MKVCRVCDKIIENFYENTLCCSLKCVKKCRHDMILRTGDTHNCEVCKERMVVGTYCPRWL